MKMRPILIAMGFAAGGRSQDQVLCEPSGGGSVLRPRPDFERIKG